ncbi:MAG: hypothetical protein RL127_1182 [Bacteroidota bacterium]
MTYWATPALSQQNFFNVPSSDITPGKALFVQQQFNLAASSIQSSTTMCVGLGHDYEVGLNVIGVTYDFKNQLTTNINTAPFSPMYAFNAQKKVELSEHWKMGIGGQFGTNQAFNGGSYVFTNAIYKDEKTGTKLVAGLYRSSDGYFGPETRNFSENTDFKKLGIQMGIEKNLWNERLLFQADFISGRHALGELVVGGAYYVSKHMVLSAGYQIPTFQSKSIDAVVVEFTWVP